MFPFLDEREKYKIRPSLIKVKQSKVHAASKGSADAGGISSRVISRINRALLLYCFTVY